MKKSALSIIAVCASTIVAFGQNKMSNAQIDLEVRKLAAAPLDYSVATDWFKIARATDNVRLKQEAVKAAGAALLCLKKEDAYRKGVRSLIDDVVAFEMSLEAECPTCGGAGEGDRQCNKCKGSGRCTYGSCRDGYVIIRGIDGSRVERCRECKGTGECPQCHGEGTIHGRCAICGGKGRGWNREAIIKAYRDHAQTARNMAGSIKIDEQKSIDPRDVEQTAWDKNQTYRFSESDKEILKKMLTQKQKSIAVNVDSSPLKNSQFDVSQLAVSLQADIQGHLGNLPYLRPISANREIVEFINSEWGESPKQDIPDYILLCRLVYASSQGGTSSVKAYFEIYDRAEGAARFSTTISKIGEKSLSSGREDTMQELFTTAAAEYMEQVADKIGPVGVVVKTSGSGRYAYVSLGKEAGLIAGGRVQILEKVGGNDDFLSDLIPSSYVDDDDGNKNVGVLDQRTKLPLQSVADGHVVESTLPEPKFAWVEIDKFNPKNPRVKRGMAVRIVPMPRERHHLAPTHTGSDLDREEAELQRERSEVEARHAANERIRRESPPPRQHTKPKPKYKRHQNDEDRSFFGNDDEDSDDDGNIFAR